MMIPPIYLVLVFALMSCGDRRSPAPTANTKGLPAQTIAVDDWRVARTSGSGHAFTKLDPSRVNWVPADEQAEATTLLLDRSFVPLVSPEEISRYGGDDLPSYEGKYFLLRGIRVLEGTDSPYARRTDRLAIESSGTTIRLTHIATRPHPFKEEAPQAVIAILTSEPGMVLPTTAIAYTGGVR